MRTVNDTVFLLVIVDKGKTTLGSPRTVALVLKHKGWNTQIWKKVQVNILKEPLLVHKQTILHMKGKD